jgi:hypothetical protein
VLSLSFQGGIFNAEWWLNTTAGAVRIFAAIGVSVGDLLVPPMLAGV